MLFSHSLMSSSLQSHDLQHTWLPCPSPSPGVCSNSCPESAMPSNHLILCLPFFFMLSTFPSISLFLFYIYNYIQGFTDSSVGKESTCNAEDPCLIPGSGRSAGKGIGYPLQYSWASLVAQPVKNLPAIQETWIWSQPFLREGKDYSLQYSGLENSMAIQSMGSQRIRHDWATGSYPTPVKDTSEAGWEGCQGLLSCKKLEWSVLDGEVRAWSDVFLHLTALIEFVGIKVKILHESSKEKG